MVFLMDIEEELEIECLGRESRCPYRILLAEQFGVEIKAACKNRLLLLDLYEEYQNRKQRRKTKLEFPDEN